MPDTRTTDRPALALVIRTPAGARIAITRQGTGYAAASQVIEGIVSGPDLIAVISAAAVCDPAEGWIAESVARIAKGLADHEERT